MNPKYSEIETDCPKCKLRFRLQDMKLNEEKEMLVCINCHQFPEGRVQRIR